MSRTPYIGDAWEQYRQAAFPHIPEDQLLQLRAAYFTGAFRALAWLEDQGAFVESLLDECYAEAATVAAAGRVRPAWPRSADREGEA